MKLPSLFFFTVLSSAPAATLTVTTTADSGAGSLREALTLAASGDTITFGGPAFSVPAGPAGSPGQVTIRLTSGPLPLKPIHLLGLAGANGGNKVVITGDADASGSPTAGDIGIFDAAPSGATTELTIERLDFANTGTPSGAIPFRIIASALTHLTFLRCGFTGNGTPDTPSMLHIEASGCDVAISHCSFSGNTVRTVSPLSIYSAANLNLFSTDFMGNSKASTSGAGGGATFVSDAENVTINSCRFLGNTSASTAGALRLSNNSNVVVRNSLFSGNSSATYGAAIVIINNLLESAPVLLRNSTFSGNSAGTVAGAIYAGSGVHSLEHCTITGNTLNGINQPVAGSVNVGAGSSMSFSGCVIAGNIDSHPTATLRAPDVEADPTSTLTSLGGNLIGDHNGSGTTFKGVADLAGTAASPLDPGLLPLADNGGPTFTHALHPFSLARDFSTGSAVTVDQRGEARPSGGARHAGAYERQVISFADWVADRLSAFPVSERQANDDPDGDGLSNGIEFIQGTAPAVAGLPLDRMEKDESGTWYSFTISNEADLDTLTAEIEESDNLTMWQPHSLNGKGPGVLVDSTNASRTRYRWPVSTAGRPKHFLRMNVRPLQTGN